jgi:hypothetical protein
VLRHDPTIPKMTITETGKFFRVSAMRTADRGIAGMFGSCGRLTTLLLLTLCAGCCTAGPILSTSQPNVVIFRGLAGYYPTCSEFEEELLEEGVCPTVALPGACHVITERIVAARNNGRLQGPLVIVGYSLGADKALVAARRLGARGITVDKLVLLEAGVHGCVPGNVRECINIYKPQPATDFMPWFRGCVVTAESPSTQLLNYNVREYNDGRYDWDNHFTLPFNPWVRDLMVNEVLSAIDGAPEQTEMLSDLGDDPAVNVAEEMPRSMN